MLNSCRGRYHMFCSYILYRLGVIAEVRQGWQWRSGNGAIATPGAIALRERVKENSSPSKNVVIKLDITIFHCVIQNKHSLSLFFLL